MLFRSRRFARSAALSSRLMVAGSSMVCRWPPALQVRSSFSKIKAGIPMWLNILMPRVSVFSQIRWDRILLCNFTLQTVMPCRSSSRRSTVQLEPCPNGLQHRRLPKQVPHCQAKLVSLASSRKIFLESVTPQNKRPGEKTGTTPEAQRQKT